MPHVQDRRDQPKRPEDEIEGMRFSLGADQLATIAKFADGRDVELEWRGAGYYTARVYDPNTRDIQRTRIFPIHPRGT